MIRLASLLVSAAALLALANCTAEEAEAAMEDPGAFACRERVRGNEGVEFAQTSARPINRDMFGTGNYDVFVGAESFRCTVDKDNNVIALTRT